MLDRTTRSAPAETPAVMVPRESVEEVETRAKEEPEGTTETSRHFPTVTRILMSWYATLSRLAESEKAPS